MKKLLALALVLMLLVGCSSGDSKTGDSASTSKVVEKGDFTRIDFVGKLDGVAFEGGTAKNYLLEIGSGKFVPGFEEQVVGIKKGEKKTIKITFPKDYQSADLAGKEVTFDVTVNAIYKEVK